MRKEGRHMLVDSWSDVSRRIEVETVVGACRLASLVERDDSSCHRIRTEPAPEPAPPVLLVGVEGRVPRGLTDLACQLVARRHRDPERGRASSRADPEPVEGGASHGSRQRTSWACPRRFGPPSRTTLYHDNRLVGCRAVKGRERRRDGRHISLGRWATFESWAPVCRGAQPARSFPAVDSPGRERRRGMKPHGRPARSRAISADRRREGPVPNVGPCGGV